MKNLIRRLFFYSSRQLLRRKRSYLSIFLTSVVLLALITTFLEMFESTFIKTIEESKSGYHHAVIREIYNNCSEELEERKRVESVFAIPYTSLLTSSVDTSTPARVVVDNDEISDYLDVKYLYGSKPKDGEIAISIDLYKAYSYFEFGKENDLYFQATNMTYFPLKVSGIFDCSDKNAGYVFVTQNTANRINKETGAKTKYDIYLRFENTSDRYIATELQSIFKEYRITDTDWQVLHRGEPKIARQYKEYINTEYIYHLERQNASPTVLYTMPVIIIAALMMASFMINWTESNSPEYGILGTIGATKRQLCAITSGQIMLIALIASIPVVLISAGISNTYISIYNSASSTDVDFVYSIPWLKLIEASLWFVLFSCAFTYVGISRLTSEAPFVLVSGSYRGKLPFVKKSVLNIKRSRDPIFKLAITRAVRNLKRGILIAFITSFVCIVCGVVFYILLMYKSMASSALINTEKYRSDMSVTIDLGIGYDQNARISSSLGEHLENIDGISDYGFYYDIDRNRSNYDDPYIKENGKYEKYSGFTCDEFTLPFMHKRVFAGDPSDLFKGENNVIIVMSSNQFNETDFKVGDKVEISRVTEINSNTGNKKMADSIEYTVVAIVQPESDYSDIKIYGDSLIFTNSGAVNLGISVENEYNGILINFNHGLSDEEKLKINDTLHSNPNFLRYIIKNYSVMTKTERQIEAVNTGLFLLAILMVYISFCTMTCVDSSLRIKKSRQEIAVLRQIGADDKSIYKTTRVETYLVPIISMAITTVFAFGLCYWITTYRRQQLTISVNEYPWAYTPELIAEIKAYITEQAIMMIHMYLCSLPIHILSLIITAISTIFPTKQLLKENITEGLRKDTD